MAKFLSLGAYGSVRAGAGPELPRFRIFLRPEYVISIEPGPVIGSLVTMVDGTKHHLQGTPAQIHSDLEGTLNESR